MCGLVWLKCPGWAETTEFHSPGDPLQGQSVKEPSLTQSGSFSYQHLLVSWKFPEIVTKRRQVLGELHHGLNKRDSGVNVLDQAGNYCICSSEAPNLCVFEQGWIWISSSAPPWTDLGRETQFSAFFSAFLPWGSHNSLSSCCLGLTLLHIPKCVKGRSGSRKEHGKS